MFKFKLFALHKLTPKKATKNFNPTISKKDKMVALTHAIFDGLGITGLITAAFWYTAAPIAPDGFSGPISTFAIGISTLLLFLFAIPISILKFRKIIYEICTAYCEIDNLNNNMIYYREDLFFSLLELRTLLKSDKYFIELIGPILEEIINQKIIPYTIMASICTAHHYLTNKNLIIDWQARNDHSYSIHNDQHAQSIPLTLKHNLISNNYYLQNTLAKSIVKLFPGSVLVPQPTKQSPKNKLREVFYGLIMSITCTEVLLSICWTVLSLLIGFKFIAPVTEHSWYLYVCGCLLAGGMLGSVFGLNKLKQNKIFSKRDYLRTCNNLFVTASVTINNLSSRLIFNRRYA